MNWCHYGDSGNVLMTGVALPGSRMEDFSHIGKVLLEIPMGVSGDTHFVEAGELKKRPGMDIFVNDNILKNIPMGAAVTIDESSTYEVEDGEVELIFEASGAYSIVISKWPFLEWRFTFEN